MVSLVTNISNSYAYKFNDSNKSMSKTENVFEEDFADMSHDKRKNFKEICDMFPGISFAVVDNLGGLVSGYSEFGKGNCFSQLGIPSITLSEEILEKLHDSEEGFKTIVAAIKTLSDDYFYWQSRAFVGDEANPTGYFYTALNIHFNERGEITFSQTLSNNPLFQNDKIGAIENLKNEYMQAFIRQRKVSLLEKLPELDKEEIFGNHLQQKLQEYDKHFITKV